MGSFSDTLYARPSVWEGWARILDFGNTLTEYNYSKSGEAADVQALWMDWATVGVAIQQAYDDLCGQAKPEIESAKAR